MALKFIQIETTSSCNQSCYFCPVSQARRPKSSMSMAMFTQIVEQLADYSIDSVFLNGFNEPTYDKQLIEKTTLLHQAELKIHLNTNGSGLNPALSDHLLNVPIQSICVNLSTLDPKRYQETRGNQDITRIIPYLEYVLTHNQHTQVELLILGHLDRQHSLDIQAISQHFLTANRCVITICPITDFAQDATHILPKRLYHQQLRGCRGERQNQWLHFTPDGTAILCCQDYFSHYKIGNIQTASLAEIYQSKEINQLRRWMSGEEIAPDDFLCRTCVFAITEKDYLADFFCQSCVLPIELGIELACQRCVVNAYL